MLALGCLAAALLAVLLDLPRGSAGAAFLLICGALAMALPAALVAWVPRAADRLSPARGEAGRAARAAPLLAGAALALPAAILAIRRLGPTFPAPAWWALPAVLAVCALVAVAPALLARGVALLAPSERAWLSVAAASALGAALFVSVHLGEGTLSAIRPGTGPLHVALFAGTLVGTALTAGALGLAADDRWALALPSRGRTIAGAAALVLGAGCLFADRRALVDLYPYVHRWLAIVGLSSVAAGVGLLAPARLRDKAHVFRIAATAAAVAGLLATGIFVRGARPAVRAELNAAPVGKTLLFSLGSQQKKAIAVTDHPLLKFDQLLSEPGPPGQLNMLLITVDALRDDQLDAGLPSLGRLARESIRFRRAYTQGTRTAVAIGALMRGTYSAHIDWRLMIYRGGKLQDPAAMSDAEMKALNGKFVYTTVPSADGPPMLAERLQKKGLYTMATAYAGDNEFFHKGGSYDLGWDAFEDMTEQKWKAPTSDNVANVALRQLDGAKGRRFFQWVHFYDPHEANGAKAKYDSYVSAFDGALGRVLDDLAARGLDKNTIIVLSADHGEALGEHGHKGHATSLYEEQSRVPLIVRLPGAPPRTIEDPVALIDVTATLAAAAGADTAGLDGVNLWPAVASGRYPARRPVFLELHRYYSNSGGRTTDLKGVVLDGYKLIVDRLKGTEQLFSLKDDPRESASVLGSQPERAAELRAVLDAFLSQAEAEHPLP